MNNEVTQYVENFSFSTDLIRNHQVFIQHENVK